MGRDPRGACTGPVCLVLSRQNVPIARPERARAGRRACAAARTCSPTPTRPTSCSSRPAPRSATALGARDLLAEKGVQARVVSMPSWELFEAQDADYRDEVLPAGVPKISVEAGDDVRLVALGRRVDRDRHVRRVGQGRQGARALRDQPGGGRRARRADDRRARRLVVRVRVGFTPAEEVAGAGRDRDRRAARDLDDLPGARGRATSGSSASARSRRRARSRGARRRARGRARQRPDRGLRLRQLAARVRRRRAGAADARADDDERDAAAPRGRRPLRDGARRARSSTSTRSSRRCARAARDGRRAPLRRRRGRVRDRRRLRRRRARGRARRRARRRRGRGGAARGRVRLGRGGHRRRLERRRTSAASASTTTSRGARAGASSTSSRASSPAPRPRSRSRSSAWGRRRSDRGRRRVRNGHVRGLSPDMSRRDASGSAFPLRRATLRVGRDLSPIGCFGPVRDSPRTRPELTWPFRLRFVTRRRPRPSASRTARALPSRGRSPSCGSSGRAGAGPASGRG